MQILTWICFQSRLEQSGLLLALCDKHNEYSKAYSKLLKLRRQQYNEPGGGPTRRDSYFTNKRSYETISNILDSTTYLEPGAPGRQSGMQIKN